MSAFSLALDAIDQQLAVSTFGRVFRLEGSGHSKERKDAKFFTEIRAGLTTFFTMSYIIAVNASILGQSGGTCVCNSTTDPTCTNDVDYNTCLTALHRDLITATAAIAGFSTVFFGLLTNLPVALAPGMGMNAYFTYQVVGVHGQGHISYRMALTAIFIEGLIFLFLSLIGMRQWLVKLVPGSVKVASGVGIGIFLTEIGLGSSGIGLITAGSNTLTEIAGCAAQYMDSSGHCEGHKMTNPAMWIGIMCGGVLTAYLMSYRVKSAIIIGISVVSILSWPRDTTFTVFPRTEAGDEKFEFFRQIVTFHPIESILAAQDWNITTEGAHFILTLFTFLYVDIIDATATLYSMARFSGVVDPESGDFPRSTLAYSVDAISISVGSLFGLSPVTAFIESGAGIAEGGRTGLTAIVAGTCFLVSIFFAPIFASVPPWATGCTLVLVGCMMMRQVTYVNWSYIGDALPAFVTIVAMPATYSVAYGLIAGLFTYTVLNGLIYITRKVSGWLGSEIEPHDADLGEYWTYKLGGMHAPWFVRAVRGKVWCIGQAEGGVGEVKSSASQKELVESPRTTSSGHQDREGGAEVRGAGERENGRVALGHRYALSVETDIGMPCGGGPRGSGGV